MSHEGREGRDGAKKKWRKPARRRYLRAFVARDRV